MKSIYLLGGSGSIGTQTLAVIEQYPNDFKLIGISLGNRNHASNEVIIKTFQPEIVVLKNDQHLTEYQKLAPNTRFELGDEGLIALATYPKPGLLVNALMGSVGLYPTIKAIESGKNIALANKETLVMAGDLIHQLVKKHAVELIPIDSEHNAILQALLGENKQDIQSITITASGGSFRDLTREQLNNVTKGDALKHPNWQMGAKITIDSATMMNKGLEVIEAHHLFGIPYHQIKTVLHKESIIHGMVTFRDESTKAILGYPDMRMPILYALSYPRHLALNIKPLDLETIGSLTFKPMDYVRYPLLALAYRVGELGGLYPTVMNAANEKAVALFLNNEISFLDIERLVIEAVESFKENIQEPTLEDILNCNQKIYEKVGK
ncbi:1-deoxy-D-xylulose-5-phosphate reductoisomerase [Paracholeplasma manati]|uniref:1-deoxy-D-xylulose-5-phosphate reductoisomerase n=1 Tax=Paracholeplasma manati TaxID=591373 RepID=UPI0024087DB8|nr:1-deoxy-D-xylulose-5-phosphate reductoisomerase [Paracholeplasma manati]MDG0889638.1 1-deoxy-D-xylulose-5-phosphate reductoisomerase [Paracholeplasma manati]